MDNPWLGSLRDLLEKQGSVLSRPTVEGSVGDDDANHMEQDRDDSGESSGDEVCIPFYIFQKYNRINCSSPLILIYPCRMTNSLVKTKTLTKNHLSSQDPKNN